MADHATTAGLRPLSTLFACGTTIGLSDAQLVERLTTATQAARSAEPAFETLLARHGPMVLGVCRRTLRDPQDVEDAFQATFLILVRKSAAVRVDDSLGRWLYGVARRVAYRARVTAEKRRARESAPAGWDAPALPGPDPVRAELLAALDVELGRLPEKYRAPVLLCDLEGLTHTEAARRLDWPLGTVKGRLAQARNLLRGRLTRRGLTPSCLVLATALKADAHPPVPAALAERTLRSALLYGLGGKAEGVVVPATVIALTRQVTRSMLISQLGTVSLGLVAAFAMTAGAGVLAQGERPDENGAARHAGEATRAGNRFVADSGDRRPANAVAVVSDVEADATMIALAPDGLRVDRGDLIAQLDSRPLKEALERQLIAESAAHAAYENAKLTREVAELAVTEYREGVYLQELETVKKEIALAEAERKLAEDRLEWSRRMSERGYLSRAQNVADKISLDKKVFAFEQATTRQSILEKFTYDKTIKELKRDVEKARADEQAREQAWAREKAARARLENQVEHCRIIAPVSGRLDHARWPVPGIPGQLTTVEKGMTVRWAQLLFWIIPDEPGTNRTR